MWVLPDGSRVSIPGQHYEWALEHAHFLKERFGSIFGMYASQADMPIRLHLLRHGCVRVKYEHKGCRLTVEAHHLHWGVAQIKACRLNPKCAHIRSCSF